MTLPNDILELIDEYKKIYNKRPEKGFNYDEFNNFDEYKEYLKKELGK